jgi:hypothetical protein
MLREISSMRNERLAENKGTGFSDELQAPGPTVISSGALVVRVEI